MKKYIKSSSSIQVESFLSQSVKQDYAEDLSRYNPGNYDQEGIGWLARKYGFNLVEMLDVLATAVELDLAKCKNPGVEYQVFPWED